MIARGRVACKTGRGLSARAIGRFQFIPRSFQNPYAVLPCN